MKLLHPRLPSMRFDRRARLLARALTAVLVGLVFNPAAQAYSAEFVRGTVVRVQKHKTQFPEYTVGGSNPSDAPLSTSYYSFEVSIRSACTIYVGRYLTPFNYLPSAFTDDKSVSVRLTKHVMYFELPDHPDLRMGIVHRTNVCGTNR
jgi:hypothetical protein